ncbi:phage integrase family protein [mine drainage metagenome]|uniref:Phage integrase family protein n=1 Tax=mine drainage metagenome TaxID=410659 RepID=T0Z2Z2_9ZZZZ
MIQTYLLAERPETTSTALFVVAKGAHRGQPLTPAGLRRIFRYHREKAGVPAGHPHALRHTFGTAHRWDCRRAYPDHPGLRRPVVHGPTSREEFRDLFFWLRSW